MTNLFQKLGSGIVTVAIAISSLLGYQQPAPVSPAPQLATNNQLGGAAPQFTAAKPTALYGGGISSSATSIKLINLVTPAGAPITTAQVVGGIGSVFYITIEPAASKKETVSCTGVTQNGDHTALLTGCSRGLQFTYPYTASTTLALSHAGGSSVVLSNSPQLYQDIIAYVDASMAAGVNNASLIAKGISQLASGLQQASSTPIGGGSTDAPLVLYSANATSTYNAATAGLKVVVTQNNGKIDQNFISLGTTTIGNIATTTTVGNGPAVNILDVGKNIRIFTTSGTFSVPSGINFFHVKVVGGGGGGGTGSGGAGQGSGGGSGGFNEGWFNLSGTSTIGITIGAAGTAGSSGGTSFFSSIASSTGGGGAGAGNNTIGGSGGTSFATTSSITRAALNGSGNPGQAGGNATNQIMTGAGASGPWGGGASGVNGGVGLPGTFCGSGGSGAMSSGGTSAGGAGFAGCVVIDW